MATQRDLALQMIQQLRVLDPSVSAEIGTPERKIIDTVAQALAENQIDLSLIAGAFDLDAKFGSDLERFLAIFGFGRQQGTQATGYIKLSRVTASAYDIPIPTNTQVVAPNVSVGGLAQDITFLTVEGATLPVGDLSVIVPIRSVTIGALGNVAAGAITEFGRTPILGITGVVNELPTSGGVDPESDDELKIRFKNTVFRNLAGTNDQYLALAVSTLGTTKANVVGPISRYREYFQVPDVDDSLNDPDSGVNGNGSAGQYTTALSTIPYSKHIYTTLPNFVSNGVGGIGAIFYREDVDYTVNSDSADRDQGDAYRGRQTDTGPDVRTDPDALYRPNVTFMNVYTGADTTAQAVRPKDVLLFEHSYMSNVSRNDFTRAISNCVDVFVNGSNNTLADVTFPRPSGFVNLFNAVRGHRYYLDHFRRVGEPNRRPMLGSLFTPLYWQPVVDLPDQISTSDATYFKGTHYWAIEDVSSLRGTVRARNGIEWATGIGGAGGSDQLTAPFTGPGISSTVDTAIAVTGYTYNRNIIDLQTAYEGAKQVTTDVLAHTATTRYFRLDLTVMYSSGISVSEVNGFVKEGLDNFFQGQFFGSTIQLSDILQVVHGARGIDNVRWSSELLPSTVVDDAIVPGIDAVGNRRDKVVECDRFGKPLVNVLVDERVSGTPSVASVQQLYLTGDPTEGTFILAFDVGGTINVTDPIAYDASSGTVQTALRTITGDVDLTVEGSGSFLDPWIVTFSTVGSVSRFATDASALIGTHIYNADFFLNDDELPALPTTVTAGDTLPGLIIRPRAQNTWGML